MSHEKRKAVRAARLALIATLALGGWLALAKEAKPDGKALFKEYCKGCHGKDAKAGEYTPMTLIGEQWERFFDQKLVPTHKAVTDPAHENKAVPETLTPEQLQTVREWLVDHAADSEHPQTCG